MRVLKWALCWIAAAAVTTVLGTVWQTQFNLAALQGLGVALPLDVRLQATASDLLGFTPSFGPLVAAALLVAFAVTALLLRWLPGRQALLYPLAGSVAITAMLLIMDAVFGLTAIAAARELGGFASLVLAGAAGGLVFVVLFTPPDDTLQPPA
jgi:hypothetical protein